MKRDNDEIQNELRVQLRLLRKAAHEFDAGDWDESRNISRALRVLCTPDNHGNRSLIEMAGVGHRDFQDTRFSCHPMSIAPYLPLIVVAIGPVTIGPRAFLGSGLQSTWTSFADWMGRDVADDCDGTAYTRKRMIKNVANLGGGTHYPADVRAFFRKLQEITYEAKRGPETVGVTLKGVELHSLGKLHTKF